MVGWLTINGLGFLELFSAKFATVADGLVLYRQHSANTLGATSTNQSNRLYPCNPSGRGVTRLCRKSSLTVRMLLATLATTSHLPPEHRANALRAAHLFELRARLHQLRGTIYTDGSHIFSRVLAFQRILMANGYRNDSAANCLGRKAFLKDLVFGLPGFYKIAKG